MSRQVTGNSILIELSDGTIMTHYRVDQDYSGLEDALPGLLDLHHSLTGTTGKTVACYGPCDSNLLQTELDAGKNLDTDFSVAQKQNKGTNRIIPDEGTSVEDIADTDFVVLVSEA